MSRALVPLAIGGAGITLTRWAVLRWVVEATVDHALTFAPQILQNRIEGPCSFGWLHTLYQLGGLCIAWELRHEIIGIARILLQVFWILLIWLAEFGVWVRSLFGPWLPRTSQQQSVDESSVCLRERGVDLTSMAVVAAPAAPGEDLLLSLLAVSS